MARSDCTEGGRGPGRGPGTGAGSTVHIAAGTKQLDVVRQYSIIYSNPFFPFPVPLPCSLNEPLPLIF